MRRTPTALAVVAAPFVTAAALLLRTVLAAVTPVALMTLATLAPVAAIAALAWLVVAALVAAMLLLVGPVA